MNRSGYTNTKLGLPVTTDRVGGVIQSRRSGTSCKGRTIRRVSIVSFRNTGLSGYIFGWSKGARKLDDSVHLGSSWVVRVNESSGSDADALAAGKYFDFPRDPYLPSPLPSEWPRKIFSSFEAMQELGCTDLSDAEIDDRVKRLNHRWGRPHAFLWNSQYFAVFLSLIILRPCSLNGGLLRARSLLSQLIKKLYNFRDGRFYLSAGGGLLLAVATGGISALFPWVFGIGSAESDKIAASGVLDAWEAMTKEFEVLQQLEDHELWTRLKPEEDLPD